MLMGIFLLAFLLRFEGVEGGLIRGMDAPEYHFLSMQMVENGVLPDEYWGFGATYHEFPGFMVLVGSASLLTGLPVSEVLPLLGPALGALMCVLTALLAFSATKKVLPSVFAGAFLAVIFVHGANTCISKPSVLGGTLYLLTLLLFYSGMKRNRSGRLPSIVAASLVMLALAVSHHLSTMFLLLALPMGIFFSPREGRAKHAFFVWYAAFFFFAFVYWHFITDNFWDRTFALLPVPWYVIFSGIAILGFASCYAPHLNNKSFLEWVEKRVTPNHGLLAFIVTISIPFFIYLFSTEPGQRVENTWTIILVMAPGLLIVFSGIGLKDLILTRKGLLLAGWLLFPLFITLAMVLFRNAFLLPHRPLEYFIPFFAILFGFAVYALVKETNGSRLLRRSVIVSVVLLMVISCQTTSFSDDLLDGPVFKTSSQEAGIAVWIGKNTPEGVVVGADHRVSAATFSYGHRNATWYFSNDFLTDPSFKRESYVNETVPAGDNMDIRAVFLAEAMVNGYVITPWDGYSSLEEDQVGKFYEPPFILIFQNQEGSVFYANYP